MVAGIQNGAEQPAPASEDTALSPDDQDDSPFSTSQEGVIAGVGDDTIYPNSPPEAAEVPDADELLVTENVSEEETASLTRKSQTLWNHGHDELWRVAARDLGLLRQNVFQSTSRFRDSEEQTLHDHWISYVESESMKLSMYTLLFLDFHIFSPCNIRPLTTPTELDWELPLASSLWEADTSLAWAQRLGDEPRTVGLTRSHDTPGMTCPTTKSLNLAMQSLMTDTPSPQLLAALRASPMATLFVLTSLDSLVRDFTRCYYQLPPALADPNAYHILTQSQNRQVSAALRYVSEIITTQIAAADSSNWHILNFAERIALSVKLALCKPDDLLIGGIVENSVVAGLTTATHLTMGLQVGARRSLQNLLRYNSGDDGMLIFLDDLMDVLSSVTSIERQDPLREAPWATVATYKILLAIWRLLRWATGEMRRKSGTQPTVRTRFEASTIVFNSILEVLQRQEDIDGQTRRLSVRESTALGMASEASEVRFMETVLQFWKGRPVWAMGSFMTTVLEEVISAGDAKKVMAAQENFGWFGLGSMGIGMALNLQKHLASNGLPPLRYSNRTLSRGESLREAGGLPERDFETLVLKSSVIFTMISNDEVLDSLVSKALDTWSSAILEGKIWVDTSTVHPDTAARCSERLAKVGATFVASPVFGASPMAAAGQLIFAMAGPPTAIEKLRPFVVNVMGKSIIDMGEDVRKSSLLKISGNIFVIGFQELTAEAQVFAEKTGLGTRQMEQFIRDMYGPVIESYSKRMTTGAYAPPLGTPPGFAVSLAAKDAGHAVRIAEEHGTRIPTIETALSRMEAARKYAGESLDSSSIYGAARLEASLPFWNENSRQSN
ncbi:zinc finger protein ADR1 [Colletotrichum limetticola]|uniref:Zinc finger protein ADR1 n=1 Tax=Colletotrichum limetticola TaxID=1209924 RepID=A0ABQ9Q381_9PEZI|nr:zinc finger protein ADR1 [Colletotrichum limetticola]